MREDIADQIIYGFEAIVGVNKQHASGRGKVTEKFDYGYERFIVREDSDFV